MSRKKYVVPFILYLDNLIDLTFIFKFHDFVVIKKIMIIEIYPERPLVDKIKSI